MRLPGTWLSGATEPLRPPPDRPLSEYLDAHYYLPPEPSANPGKWTTRAPQREILDAIGDMSIRRVSVKKSSRFGLTLMVGGGMMRWIDEDPRTQLMVQPRVVDAQTWSKIFFTTMVRDNPRLRGKVSDGVKKSGATILSKSYPGGRLTIVGANSGAGFRMLSCNIVWLDEVDAYPPSAGSDGDPVKLAETRAADFWDGQIVAMSTPLVDGESRIDELFLDGDQRHYHVPCPTCGHMDLLVFDRKSGKDGEKRGHYMQWPKDEPGRAYFVCRANGCVIEERDKGKMIDQGEWVADQPFDGHASFHIWRAYSTSAANRWGDIARAWVDAQGKDAQLQVVTNTILGQTWTVRGEAPEWEDLYARRQPYLVGSVPDGVVFLTAGVDVQHDRFVYEVVGWDLDKRSWSIDAGELYGDTADTETYKQLDALLQRHFPRTDGTSLTITRLAIDAGDGNRTQNVYNWARRYRKTYVMACIGRGKGTYALLNTPQPVDIKWNGTTKKNGYKVYKVGVNIAKAELYGWLHLKDDRPEKPDGWCTFPAHPPEFFRQLTGEQRITTVSKRGHSTTDWVKKPGFQNHWMDARILARAAASAEGIDKVRPSTGTGAAPAPPAPPAPTASTPAPAPQPKRKARQRKTGNWMKRPTGNWMKR